MTTEEIFVSSVSTYKDQQLKARMALAARRIQSAAAGFLEAALSGDYSQVTKSPAVGPVSKSEMINLYDNKLVKSTTGRAFYERLLGQPGSRCPLCAHRDIETLDHFLDKALYPALSVTPENLLPACSKCNRSKMHHHPTAAEDFTLNPYFDRLGDERWLHARILKTSPPAFVFAVQAPESWSLTLAARVKRHFGVMQLATLYGAQAANELQNIRWNLKALGARGGADAIEAWLRELAISAYSHHRNSWRTALYDALANDSWFWRGGFNA